MNPIFLEIDKKRRASRRTVGALCRDANIPVSTWWRVATGRKKAWRAATVRRLEAALAGKPVAHVKKNGDPAVARWRLQLIQTAYRGHIVAISATFGLDPEEVLASDPRRSATQDEKWAAAAKVRALAIFCTSVGLGITGAELGRAIGMTKQAVCWNIARIGKIENHPKYGPIIEAASRLVTARPHGAELGATWGD